MLSKEKIKPGSMIHLPDIVIWEMEKASKRK